MDSDFEKPVQISQDLDDYKSFFDHSWARTIDEIAKDRRLRELVFDLCAVWKGTANTHRMPWLLPNLTQSFSDGQLDLGDTFVGKMVEKMAKDLPDKMRGVFSGPARARLRTILNQMANEVRRKRTKPIVEFEVGTKMWSDLVSQQEFQVSLWATQRLCYGAVYFAYEDFVICNIKLVKGVDNYRIPQKESDFRAEFSDLYDEDLFEECWADGGVEIARLVRHALVHNGGRLTRSLEGKKKRLSLIGNEIQILPSHTRSLFDLLKIRASSITRETQARL